MCQHEATKFCTEPMEGLGMESAYFCVNHGECNVEDVRQGCDCPTGWVSECLLIVLVFFFPTSLTSVCFCILHRMA